jgi:hypothetical protein
LAVCKHCWGAAGGFCAVSVVPQPRILHAAAMLLLLNAQGGLWAELQLTNQRVIIKRVRTPSPVDEQHAHVALARFGEAKWQQAGATAHSAWVRPCPLSARHRQPLQSPPCAHLLSSLLSSNACCLAVSCSLCRCGPRATSAVAQQQVLAARQQQLQEVGSQPVPPSCWGSADHSPGAVCAPLCYHAGLRLPCPAPLFCPSPRLPKPLPPSFAPNPCWGGGCVPGRLPDRPALLW